ncbi:hypothetical protein [Limosilactobacillus coleohominis]|uniref:hypothetical protein n=1 Tax=Limosilactobacillus coleohominis TaxID=181675 RepID=UPI0026EC2B00|nr:hypothetical protein [Limosilactobacillus coleohominis]
MRIDLDEHYSIELNKWGNPVLVKHKVNAEVNKDGHLIGAKLYFQTFGQAIKSYIKVSASESKIKSFQEMAAFIDGKLKGAELKIDKMMEDD